MANRQLQDVLDIRMEREHCAWYIMLQTKLGSSADKV